MVRTIAVYSILTFSGLFLGATVIHSSFPGAYAPDFILILAVAVSFFHRSAWGVFGVFLLGLASDFASAEFLGPNAGGCLVAFFAVGLMANRVYAEKGIAVAIIVFFCAVIKSSVQLGFLLLYAPTFNWENSLIHQILYSALLTGIVAPIVLRVARGSLSLASVTRPGIGVNRVAT